MTNDSNRPDVAVFIDFENVYVSVRDKLDANPNFEAIMDRCEDLGRVVIARAYADWYRYPRITSALYANTIEPMYVPTYYYDRDLGRTGRAIKNSVDMNLCVDAMRTLYTNPNIAKFVLATGDRDFIPLVNSIRQQGKEVIVIGIGGAASAHLAQSADEFIFYESLIGKPSSQLLPDQPRNKMPEKGRENEADTEQEAPPERRERERSRERSSERSTERSSERSPERSVERSVERNGEHREPERVNEVREPERTGDANIYDVLVQAVKLARERGYVCSFGSLKLLMKELMGGEFKEARYKDAQGRPFAKFKDFVMEGERRGKVQVFTNGTVNEVFLPGENPLEISQFAGDLREDPAPALPIADTPQERRSESRDSLNNGRRRRRRPRGGRPNTSADATFGDELLDADALDASEDAPEEQLDGELIDSAESDALFESLLEQVEQEQQETEPIDMFDALTFVELPPETLTDEPIASIVDEDNALSSTLPSTEPPMAFDGSETAQDMATIEPTVTMGRPFDEEDWRVLRAIVARFERPVSFVQIHDALRDARNRNESSRTNEELRTLVKQAINTGILERTGKGNRIAYRIAQFETTDEVAPAEPTEETADQTTLFEETASEQQPEETAQTMLIDQALEDAAEPTAEAADQSTLFEEVASGQPFDQPEETAQTMLIDQAVEDAAETQATSAEELTDAAATIDQATLIAQATEDAAETEATSPEQLTEKQPAGASENVATPDQATLIEQVAQASAPAESAPAAPKRTRRRKAAPAEAPEEAAPVPEASAPAEESPKPRRRTRKPKAETPETQE